LVESERSIDRSTIARACSFVQESSIICGEGKEQESGGGSQLTRSDGSSSRFSSLLLLQMKRNLGREDDRKTGVCLCVRACVSARAEKKRGKKTICVDMNSRGEAAPVTQFQLQLPPSIIRVFMANCAALSTFGKIRTCASDC